MVTCPCINAYHKNQLQTLRVQTYYYIPGNLYLVKKPEKHSPAHDWKIRFFKNAQS